MLRAKVKNKKSSIAMAMQLMNGLKKSGKFLLLHSEAMKFMRKSSRKLYPTHLSRNFVISSLKRVRVTRNIDHRIGRLHQSQFLLKTPRT
jgi:hypothetical protein